MKTYCYLITLSLCFIPLTCFASENEDIECQGEEVKVCFADGECLCKLRQIELTDPVPQINECQDPEDTGVCSEQS